MNRRLFNILSYLSLLLFVVVAASWVRSHFAGDLYGYATADGTVRSVSSAKGLLSINHAKHDPRSIRKGIWHFGDGPHYPITTLLAPRSVPQRLGFWWIVTQTRSGPFVGLVLPYWSITATTLLLPGLWLIRWWREAPLRQNRHGLCPTCGYDLRATPDRCPECGTTTAASP